MLWKIIPKCIGVQTEKARSHKILTSILVSLMNRQAAGAQLATALELQTDITANRLGKI